MLAITSTDDVLHAMRNAHDISLLAYTLRPGRIEDALLDAAGRGAHVRVRLEGKPRYDPDGSLLADNRAVTESLVRAGADARLVHADDATSEPPLHAKAVLADGALYLDDRNWADDGEDTIVRDDFARDTRMVRDAAAGRGDESNACFAIRKRDAQGLEASLLARAASGDDIVLESESFGDHNRVYAALARLGDAGAHPRVLVSARDLQANTRERNAILRLESHGVAVRSIDADEKFAFAGSRGWIGSTNATASFDRPDQLDWGARTNDPPIVHALRARFDERWSRGAEITTA